MWNAALSGERWAKSSAGFACSVPPSEIFVGNRELLPVRSLNWVWVVRMASECDGTVDIAGSVLERASGEVSVPSENRGTWHIQRQGYRYHRGHVYWPVVRLGGASS